MRFNTHTRILKTLFLVVLCCFTVSPGKLIAQEKFKIALWGDSRENLDGACEQIADVLLHKITDWDIQVHTGDFTHHGAKEDWERTLKYKGVRELFKKGKFFMSTSNHDGEPDSNRVVYDAYTKDVLPTNSADGSTHFYAYDRGNVHLVFCDSYFTDSVVMQKWLDTYLQSVKPSDWIIGVWHQISYGDLTYKESYLDHSLPWLKSLQAHGGDMVFNGHAHVYLRTKPLSPEGNIDEVHGMVNIVNGTGGASWKDAVTPNPKIAYTPSVKSFPCITFLTFKGDSVHLQTIDARPASNLNVIDEWSWTR